MYLIHYQLFIFLIGPTEEMYGRHLVDHFLAELNHFATLSGPAMDKACGKCPAELGNKIFQYSKQVFIQYLINGQ